MGSCYIKWKGCFQNISIVKSHNLVRYKITGKMKLRVSVKRNGKATSEKKLHDYCESVPDSMVTVDSSGHARGSELHNKI